MKSYGLDGSQHVGQQRDDTSGSGGPVQQLFDDGVRELVNSKLLLGEQAQYLASMVDLLLNREIARASESGR